MDDFGLKLQGVFDESSIQKKLQSMNGKFNLVVNLKFDSSQLQKELSKIKVDVKSATTKADSASSKVVGGVPSIITAPIVEDISKIKTEFDDTGKITGEIIEKMHTLDSVTKEYYKTAEDGTAALIKSEQSRDTGLRKQLQLQNQNEKSIKQMTYSLNEFKNQGSLTDKEFQNFSNTLKEVGSGENFEQVGFELKSLNKSINESVKLNNQNEKSIYGTGEAIKYLGNQSKLSKKEVEIFNARLEEIKTDVLDPIERSKALTKLNTDIKTAANSTGILGQSFAKAATKYVTWLGIATAVALVQRALKDMVSEVVQLDTAMVELNKVFDATDSQLNKVKDSAFELASQLGSTGLEVVNATTEFKRMGYTIDESLDLAKVAIMLTNVAEGLTDAGEAASIITSILKGLNVEAEYAESILDRLNEISNNNAVSLATLADMAQRASATMNILGNTFDETLGLLTGAYEVLQDERVAKGIQTIGLRIAGLNEDLETEVGLANQVTKALQKYAGINVFDEQTGQIKSTYAILEELSEKWDTLNKNTQVTLQNILGGKERADVVAAILTNWEGVTDAVQDASNSMGSAVHEQQKYLDSIEGKQKALANAWQELATKTISGDFVKVLIDITTIFLKLVNAFGGLIPILTTILGLVIAFKGQNIIAGLKSMFQGVKNLAGAFKALNSSFGAFGLAVTGISFVIGIFSGIATAINNAKEAQEELRQETIKTAQEQRDKLSDLQDEYTTLYDKVSRTEEENSRLLAIQKSLVENYGQLKKGIDEVNGSYEDYIDLISKAGKYEAQKELAAMAPDVAQAQKTLEKTKKVFGRLYSAENLMKLFFPESKGFTYQEALGIDSIISGKTVEQIYEELRRKFEELSTKQIAGTLTSAEVGQLSKVTTAIESYEKAIKNANETLQKEADLKKIINGETDKENQITEEQTKKLNELRKQIREYNNALSETLANKQAQREEDEKTLELNEKLLAVQKKQLALAEARRKKVTVFRSGVGYVQASDFSEVQEAEEDLKETLDDLADYNFDIAYDRAKEFVTEVNTLLSSDNILEGWKELFTEFGDLLDTEFADYLTKADEFVKKFNNEWGKTNFIDDNNNSSNHNASGTTNWKGGTTWVGENGPEIVNLPRGTEILSNTKSNKLTSIVNNPSKYLKSANGGGTVLQFNGDLSFPNVRNGNDAQGFVQALKDLGVSKTPKLT